MVDRSNFDFLFMNKSSRLHSIRHELIPFNLEKPSREYDSIPGMLIFSHTNHHEASLFSKKSEKKCPKSFFPFLHPFKVLIWSILFVIFYLYSSRCITKIGNRRSPAIQIGVDIKTVRATAGTLNKRYQHDAI